MSEERFWTNYEYVITAKFAVHDGAMTMRQAGLIFRLNPAPPKVKDINDYIISDIRENDLTYFTYFLHQYELRLNKLVYRFLLTEKNKKIAAAGFYIPLAPPRKVSVRCGDRPFPAPAIAKGILCFLLLL